MSKVLLKVGHHENRFTCTAPAFIVSSTPLSMSSYARLIGLVVLIILFFFATAFVSQGWLHHEHLQAQDESTETLPRTVSSRMAAH